MRKSLKYMIILFSIVIISHACSDSNKREPYGKDISNTGNVESKSDSAPPSGERNVGSSTDSSHTTAPGGINTIADSVRDNGKNHIRK